MEQRIDRLEFRVDKLEEKAEKQGLDFAETRVYVKEIYKKMDEIKASLEVMKKESGSEWKQFFEKGFWLAAGAVVAYLAGKIHF